WVASRRWPAGLPVSTGKLSARRARRTVTAGRVSSSPERATDETTEGSTARVLVVAINDRVCIQPQGRADPGVRVVIVYHPAPEAAQNHIARRLPPAWRQHAHSIPPCDAADCVNAVGHPIGGIAGIDRLV